MSEFRRRLIGMDTDNGISLPDYSGYRGVFVEDVQGFLYDESEWDDTKIPNGIAVLTDNCRFVIALEDAIPNSVRWWSDNSYGLIDGVTTTDDWLTAKQDYNGRNNTSLIVDTKCTAVMSCINYSFPNGSNGYLGASGEWWTAFEFKSLIEPLLTKLGGNALLLDYWTSTQYDEDSVWFLGWTDDYMDAYLKSYSSRVRAFTPLKSDVK